MISRLDFVKLSGAILTDLPFNAPEIVRVNCARIPGEAFTRTAFSISPSISGAGVVVHPVDIAAAQMARIRGSLFTGRHRCV